MELLTVRRIEPGKELLSHSAGTILGNRQELRKQIGEDQRETLENPAISLDQQVVF